jgi:hypothetical protein
MMPLKTSPERVINQLSDLVSTSLGQVLWQARTASSGHYEADQNWVSFSKPELEFMFVKPEPKSETGFVILFTCGTKTKTRYIF